MRQNPLSLQTSPPALSVPGLRGEEGRAGTPAQPRTGWPAEGLRGAGCPWRSTVSPHPSALPPGFPRLRTGTSAGVTAGGGGGGRQGAAAGELETGCLRGILGVPGRAKENGEGHTPLRQRAGPSFFPREGSPARSHPET